MQRLTSYLNRIDYGIVDGQCAGIQMFVNPSISLTVFKEMEGFMNMWIPGKLLGLEITRKFSNIRRGRRILRHITKMILYGHILSLLQ